MKTCKLEYIFNQKIIETNHMGVCEIIRFYDFACQHSYTSIKLNLLPVEKLDANLACLLLAFIKKAARERKIYFFVEIPQHMHVLYRNGFYNLLLGKTDKAYDERESVIPCKIFDVADDDGFTMYLKNDFFGHRGLEQLSVTKRGALKTAFLEVFTNVELHASTSECYTSGQYFPASGLLKFTLLDLGAGFLKKINAATGGIITSSRAAIDWAVLPGHSTKDVRFGKGGYGLPEILDYCRTNNGSLHIASGDCYWMNSGTKLISYPLRANFPGSMINMIFRGINN